MRIALVNPSDAKGGAARVALALANGLRSRGHEVTYFVQTRTLPEPWIELLPSPPNGERLGPGWKLLHRAGLNSLNLTSHLPRAVGAARWQSFDIIHLHDAPMFNWGRLPWLSRQAPLVWTMHTPAPFTGNCLYPLGCERFTQNCGGCPRFGEFPLDWLHRDGSGMVLRAKRLLAAAIRLRAVVGVSRWISDLARKSLLGRFPIRTIANPVDGSRFVPRDRDEARKRLGLPPDKPIILTAISPNPKDTRKGFDLAVKALAALQNREALLLPLGISSTPEPGNRAVGSRILDARHLANDEELNWHYAAADLVWHPSRADTSSMISLESMATGTPVIAAAVGGVPEVIGAGTEAGGILIPPDDPAALAIATDALLKDPERRELLGRQGRLGCLRHHSPEHFLDDHETLYRSLLASA